MKRTWPLLATLALAMPVSAQTVKLDEGTFRVSLGNREVGTETFWIRQNGTGADAFIIAQGRVTLAHGEEVGANVRYEGALLRPAAYDVELKGSEPRQIHARVTGTRASARSVSTAGETMKEYLVSDGAILLDESVAHHYYFIVRRAGSGGARVSVIIPREHRQSQATVTAAGEESLTVGTETVRARRFNVDMAGDARSVWVDAQGRVLKLEIPGKNYVAVRTTLP